MGRRRQGLVRGADVVEVCDDGLAVRGWQGRLGRGRGGPACVSCRSGTGTMRWSKGTVIASSFVVLWWLQHMGDGEVMVQDIRLCILLIFFTVGSFSCRTVF